MARLRPLILTAVVTVAIVGAVVRWGRDTSAPQSTPARQAKVAAPPPAAARASWPFGAGQGAATSAASTPGAAASAASAPGAPREFDPASLMKRNFYVVFDASGSMNERKCSGDERKIDVAKRALAGFVAQMPADANLGLLVFDNRGTRQLLPIGKIDRAALDRSVAAIFAGGATPLAESIELGYRALTARAVEQLGYGEYHLVVITDGEATGEDPRRVVDNLSAQSPVVLHTIGFCIGANHSLNQPGRTVYRAADSPQELAEGLSDVLAEAPEFKVVRFK
jgi:Mg-chelatase subunit ChlD